jgi:hypothetical protein
LLTLRDKTEWIIVPSVNDPGQNKLMPGTKLSEFFISTMKGIGPNRIKNLTIGTNPIRLNFYGKEIVISKYSFYKKLKRNQLPKI